MLISCETPSEAVVDAIETLKDWGELTSPRGMSTMEITNAQIMIQRPWLIPFEVGNRNLRPFIGCVEALQLVGQVAAPNVVVKGSSAFNQFTDDGIFHGAYGMRVYGHLSEIVELLKRDPDSRQAVLTIFNAATDLGRGKRDIPCTLTIQFLIRRGKLNMRVSMRSNDVFLGLPYDLVQFGALQAAIAKALDIEMGWYCHVVGSLHMYLRDLNKCEDLQPESTEFDYFPLWSGNTIEEISGHARSILFDFVTEHPLQITDFERDCYEAVSPTLLKLRSSDF